MLVRRSVVTGLSPESSGHDIDDCIQGSWSDLVLATLPCTASYTVAILMSPVSCEIVLYHSSVLMLTTRARVRLYRPQDTICNKTTLISDAGYKFRDPQATTCVTIWL